MWKSTGGNNSTPENGGSILLTPGTPTSERKDGAQNVMAVNIRDALEAPEGTLTIEGTKAHMISLVGTLEKIEMKPANVVYTIRDDSGVIKVIQWIEGEDDNPMSLVGVVENTFVRVVGCIRHNQELDQHVMAFRVAPLRSANEITTHLLETIFVPLKLRQIKKTTNNRQPANGATAAAEGMAGPLASTSKFDSVSTCNQPCNESNKEAETLLPPAIPPQRNLNSNEPINNPAGSGSTTAIVRDMAGPLASTSNLGSTNIPQRIQPKKEVVPPIAQRPRNAVAVPRCNPYVANRESWGTSRRNKTPEEVRQEQQWGPTFDRMFQKFLTAREPEDKWTFEFLNEVKMKKYRLPSVFTKSAAMIRFRCSETKCNHTWNSHKGSVTFWIHRNPSSSGKQQGGQVLIFISGQQCQYCEGLFENGDLDENGIERVLTKLLTKIEIKIYGEEKEKDETGPSAPFSPKGEHRSELCQACCLGLPCNAISEIDQEPIAKRSKRYM